MALCSIILGCILQLIEPKCHWVSIKLSPKTSLPGAFSLLVPPSGVELSMGAPPFGTSLAQVIFSWVRRGVIGSPASFLLQIPQLLTRFSALDLLNLHNFCGVLTLMFISNGILGSVCVTSFWLVTCSFNFLFFAFSFFVFFSCFLIFLEGL